MRLYHNPKCSKSRAALALLGDRDVDVIEYLQQPLSKDELRDICTLLRITPTDLLRKGESAYKELVELYGEPDDETALAWMHEDPRLMQRPIFVHNNKAVIGRPPENILTIL